MGKLLHLLYVYVTQGKQVAQPGSFSLVIYIYVFYTVCCIYVCKYWWILSVAIYSYVLPEAGKICICLSKRDIKFSASTSPANTPFSWLFTEFLEFRNCEISIFNVRNVFYNIQVRVWIKGDIVFKRKFYLFFLKAPPLTPRKIRMSCCCTSEICNRFYHEEKSIIIPEKILKFWRIWIQHISNSIFTVTCLKRKL